MTTVPMRIWKAGERCRITCGGRTVDGRIELAASSGVSLVLCFDGMLYPGGDIGGYPGGMPVMWNGTAFQDWAGRGIIELAEVAR
jgi:hypothetical protein